MKELYRMFSAQITFHLELRMLPLTYVLKLVYFDKSQRRYLKRQLYSAMKISSPKYTYECHQNGLQWFPRRCSVVQGGPSSQASCTG